MSVNTTAAINRIYQEFNTTLLSAFKEAPQIRPVFATEVPSSSRSTLHAWLGNQSMVREWFGKRKANSMGTRSWEIVNRNWELSYQFEVNQIADDMSGLVSAAVAEARSQGAQWSQFEDYHCAQVLEAGTSALCWDGQYFFDTDHPVDIEGLTSGTWSNLLTGSALTHANVDAALTRLHSWKLENGMPMVPPGSKLTLMHPPALRLKAKQILVTESLTAAASYGLFGTSGASQNPLVGAMTPVENAYLTSDTTWYVIVDRAGMKPILFQRRQGVEMQELGAGSQLYFDEKKVQIGGDARFAASYGLPQLAICSQA